MKFTQADRIDAIKHFFDALDMQVPLPMQSLCSLDVLSDAEAAQFKWNNTITRVPPDYLASLSDSEAKYHERFPLWQWNIKVMPKLLLRLPLWRGDEHSNKAPETEEETIEIVKQCFAELGIDVDAATREITAIFQGAG